MQEEITKILEKPDWNQDDLVALLQAPDEAFKIVLQRAVEVKQANVGNKTYLRGLLEFSNICAKNCFYCGIRRSNGHVDRYFMSEEDMLKRVRYALKNRFASVVLQSGERTDHTFTRQVTTLIEKIRALAPNEEIGITLSLGEQSREVYREWHKAGANRYLIRIEASNRQLYENSTPTTKSTATIGALKPYTPFVKKATRPAPGVMIGLPFQTTEDLADDLLFMKNFDIDMVGMGPYIEHQDTPLYQYRHQLQSKTQRFNLSLRMVALLRIMMKDINIAATTAMQALDKMGREKAIKFGANVIMPNLTPVRYRDGYLLYEDKPCLDEEAEECQQCLEHRIAWQAIK